MPKVGGGVVDHQRGPVNFSAGRHGRPGRPDLFRWPGATAPGYRPRSDSFRQGKPNDVA